MKTRIQTLTLLAAIVLLAGCATLFRTIVTITEVRAQAMTELAGLHARGLITPELDKKIDAIDLRYRQSAEVAENALIAYKAGGDQAAYLTALNVTRSVVFELLDILTPMLTQEKSTKLNTTLTKASLP